ncbi:MAG: sulfate ABC transporter permease subunit CysT [Tepidisphaeraceae bacterium]
MARSQRNVLPGFGLSLGYTLFYLSLIVLIPLGALATKTTQLSWSDFKQAVGDPFVVSAYKLSIGASIAAAIINGVMGLAVAWTLVRDRFPGRRILDSIIDLPFAMPTAVAGLTFASIFGDIPFLSRDGSDPYRVTLMLVFVGLPFVIRTVQPVLQDWDTETEQAAMSLGAGRGTIFRRIIVPTILPAWISGVALAFARCVGEYGSIVFISGNIPGKSQIAPQQIIEKLDQFNYPKATAIGLVLLLISLAILMLLNTLDYLTRRHER